MSLLDLTAVAGGAVITLAFSLARFSELVFVAAGGAVVLVSALLVTWVGGQPAEAVLLVIGLALYFFGLLIVRVMLHRSVSLRMLAACDGGRAGEESRDDIRARLVDVERYRLAVKRDDRYGLTAFGRLIAGAVAALYRVTSVET